MIEVKKVIGWYRELPIERKNKMRMMSEYTYHSCALEGNTLTFEETKKLHILLEYAKENNISEEEIINLL